MGITLFDRMKNIDRIYFRILILCLIFSTCTLKRNNDIDSLFIKNEIKWGMNYKTVKTILGDKCDLTFFMKEQLSNKTSFIFLGGTINGIKMKGVKLLFTDDAIEGMDIWIDSKTTEEMLWKYSSLSGYFTKVAEVNIYASNDAWMFYTVESDGKKKCETDLFMLQEKNKILIHIHQAYENKESIFIY
jgi:hypothetical protein